jgi:hypothetical protein
VKDHEKIISSGKNKSPTILGYDRDGIENKIISGGTQTDIQTIKVIS